MPDKNIPFHDFSEDDSTSVPFKLLPLEVKKDYDFSVPHRHNYYEIFIFRSGGGAHCIDFKSYGIESNSIHFVSPGQVHHVQRTAGSYGYVILFSRGFFSQHREDKDFLFDLPFLNNNGAAPVFNLNPGEMEVFYSLLKNIENEFVSEEKFREEILHSYLNIFLLQMLRVFSSEGQQKAMEAPKLFSAFKLLVEKNFSGMHKVKDYAEILHASEKTLNETVKRISGKTASEYIFDRIILEAKRLLRHSEFNIKEISYFLNYDDPAHFSKFFKLKTGHSPSEFKENKSRTE